ncbi:hypothetical protein Ciccas_000370 [Cichlidogyrus casuarinus]|uniref:Uncharacterized protein n=1 Tax=Cichlidogyrus casuarinus TaxID=1844966 RepID=A0ABD2QN50_9PLAT
MFSFDRVLNVTMPERNDLQANISGMETSQHSFRAVRNFFNTDDLEGIPGSEMLLYRRDLNRAKSSRVGGSKIGQSVPALTLTQIRLFFLALDCFLIVHRFKYTYGQLVTYWLNPRQSWRATTSPREAELQRLSASTVYQCSPLKNFSADKRVGLLLLLLLLNCKLILMVEHYISRSPDPPAFFMPRSLVTATAAAMAVSSSIHAA